MNTPAAKLARLPRLPTALGAQRWTATLAAVMAFLACSASGDLGIPLTILFFGSVAGAARFGERSAHRFPWAWTSLLLVSLLVLGGMFVAGRVDIVLGAARFVLLLMVHRLWNRASVRDEILLLLLSLLLLCGGGALSAELFFGVAFVAFAISATWALVLLHLRGEIESGRSAETSHALLASRRLATPKLLLTLAVLAVAGLTGSALVFFTFPRVAIGGFRRAAGARVAGLSDRIDLGGQGSISDDPRVVLRVRLPGKRDGDLDWHWRARALELWTGRGWQARGQARRLIQRLPHRPRGDSGPAELQQVEMEAVSGFSDGVVVTPEGWPLAVDFVRPLTARADNRPRLLRDDAGDLYYAPTEVGDLTYNVLVDKRRESPAGLRGRGRDYPREIASSLLVPRLDQRVRALAEELTRGRDPADAAVNVEKWLSSNLKYTRDLGWGAADPVADFLFVRKEGHCELFATAMVLMLRAAGVPARAVTGYYGGKLTSSGYYALRGSDAHSWVEVYVPGSGYVPFDPTPPSERGSNLDTLWAQVVLAWDSVAARWRAAVVDYDLVAQGRLLKSLLGAVGDAARRFSGKSGTSRSMNIPWLGLGALAAAIALAIAARLAWRRRGSAPSAALHADQRRAARLWRAARSRLARAGLQLSPGFTPREAIRRAAIFGPAAQTAAGHLASRYLASRWGGEPLPQSEARALLRELDRTL